MLDFSQEGVEVFRGRFFLAFIVVFLFVTVVFVRLFQLQIVGGRKLRLFSSDHTVKEIMLPAPRGVLFDRNRVPLVQSRPSFDLVMIRQYVKDIGRLRESLHLLFGLSPETVDEKWDEIRKQAPFYPLVILPDLSIDQVAKVRVAQSVATEEGDLDLRGVDVIPRPIRDYPLGASNYFGYLTEISSEELTLRQNESPGRYALGDQMGAAGLERFWENDLKGVDGFNQRIVDAKGREVKSPDFEGYLKNEKPRPGANLFLSVDHRLQETADKAFGEKSGALVALNLANGGILAMVSRPTFDPAKLQSLAPVEWQKLTADPGKLFLNRAVQGSYPPGSTYKIVNAVAALEEKVVGPEERIPCAGGLQFGGRFFRCWKSGGHGPMKLVEAIAQSCDTYFYTMGIRLGVDRLAKYATLLGLGHPTGVDLVGEKGGLIPTAAWKEKLFKAPWQPGENLSIAIGQGYDTVTPIGNAIMAGRVASGKEIHPHFVERVEEVTGEIVKEVGGEAPADLPLSPETLKLVREGMAEVVASPAGTAHRLFTHKFSMAGKTGTAQTVSEEAKARGVRDPGDHALFIAYAPVDHPEIAVSVVVEHGGHGGTAAAPIAKEVITRYFQIKKEETDASPR